MILLTPPGVAGIAVLQVESPAELLVLGIAPESLTIGGIRRCRLRVGGEDLDEALVVARAGGGHELHLHGSPAVLRRLASVVAVRRRDARDAAEALFRGSLSTEQLELALEQTAYDRVAEFRAIRAMDEPGRTEALEAARVRSRQARALAEPRRVVLVGEANAGKSTLFNALLAADRALTGSLPGLTRDAVTETTTLDGYPYELVDTPGAMDRPDAIAAAAFDLAHRFPAGGATIVVVADRSAPPPTRWRDDGCDRLLVATKADLPPAPWPDSWRPDALVSCHCESPDGIRARLGQLLRRHRQLPVAGPVGGPAALDASEWRAFDLGEPD